MLKFSPKIRLDMLINVMLIKKKRTCVIGLGEKVVMSQFQG